MPRAVLQPSPSAGLYQAAFERAREEGWLCRGLHGGHYAMLTAVTIVATALLEIAGSPELS